MEIIDSTGRFKATYQPDDGNNIYFGTIDDREIYANYYISNRHLTKFYTKWDVEIDKAVNELLARKDELLNPKPAKVFAESIEMNISPNETFVKVYGFIEKMSKTEQFKAFINPNSIEIIDTSNLHTVCNIEKDSDYICITKTYVGNEELLEFIKELEN